MLILFISSKHFIYYTMMLLSVHKFLFFYVVFRFIFNILIGKKDRTMSSRTSKSYRITLHLDKEHSQPWLGFVLVRPKNIGKSFLLQAFIHRESNCRFAFRNLIIFLSRATEGKKQSPTERK